MGVTPDTRGYGTRGTYHAWRVEAMQLLRRRDGDRDVKEISNKAEDASISNACKLFMDSTIVLAMFVVACGCACQAPYELLNSRDRGCGDMIALSEYVYGLVASAPQALNATQWHIPWRFHFGLSLSALGYSALVNVALATQMPMPVAITMKNGNLVANMVVGLLVLGRRYSWQQVVAVLVTTVGLAVTALAGKNQDSSTTLAATDMDSQLLVGVVCLTGALLCRAAGGALQELAGAQCGASPVAELLFFRSLLGLPFFVLRGQSISNHWQRWQDADVNGIIWPGMWLLLLGNLFFDYLCKCYMTGLVSKTSALTATLVLTIQRFISFMISALVLNPLPTEGGKGAELWLGSGCVLIGTLAYSAFTWSSANPMARETSAAKKTD